MTTERDNRGAGSDQDGPRPDARSEAERFAVTQRNVQIALVATNVVVTCLIALKTFDII
jgi:hypothetical protein